MRCSRRLGALGATSVLVFASCSSSGSDLRTVASDVEVGSPPVSGDGQPSAEASGEPAATPLLRWGDGRAVAARRDTARGRTAVVTTVGVFVRDDVVEPGDMGEPVAELDELTTHVALDSSGRLLATVGERAVVAIWDLDERRAATAPITAVGPVTRLEFTSDSTALIVSTPTAVTRVPIDGSAPAELLADAGGALGPAVVAPDGSWVMAPLADPAAVRVAVWRADGSSAVTLDVPDAVNATDAVAVPDGSGVAMVTQLASDPFEATLVIWDVDRDAVTGTVPLDDGAETAWGLDGSGAALTIDASGAELWSTSGASVGTLTGAPDLAAQWVFGLATGGFVTVWRDGSIEVYGADGARRQTSPAAGAALVEASFEPGGSVLTTVDYFGTVQRWSVSGVPGSLQAATVTDGIGVVNSVAFAPDDSRLALATSSGFVETIDGTGAHRRTYDQKVGNVDSVAFSPDASTMASAMGQRRGPESFDDTVTIFDVASGAASASFGGEAEQVAGCAFFRNEVRFSPDGQLLAANSHDFTVSLYDPADGSILHTFPAHLSTVTDLAFSPDGSLLATSSDDSTLRVWSVADRQLVHEYQTPAGGYWSLVFGADGQTLVVADLPGNVSVIDLADGSVTRTFAGQKDRLAELAISPDGSLVASGGAGNTVELWETATGKLVGQLAGHAAPVVTLAFSADGTRLASGSQDATVRLWSV